jgi:D-amino-acid dehydrogenase
MALNVSLEQPEEPGGHRTDRRQQMSDVVVIGAGIIGLGIAFELSQRGASVTLVDRREPGRGASRGNTGWIVPSLSAPIPAPGLIRTSLAWLTDPDAPLRIPPTSLPRLAPWLLRFLGYCNRSSYQAGLGVVGCLNAETLRAFAAWRSAGLEFEWRRNGILFTALNPTYLDHIAENLEYLEPFGYDAPTRLEGRELRDVEPALRPEVETAVLVESDAHVRPEALVESLCRSLRSTGTSIRSGEAVRSVRTIDRRILAVETDRGAISGSWFVIAAGAWSGDIAAMTGVRLPVASGKGYSVTIERPALALRRPLYLGEARVACSPFDGANRFAGMMELTGDDETIEPRRLLGMGDSISRFLAGWDTGTRRRAWAGLRSLAPDGLPLLGALPGYENAVVATGHGMLGVTMAPVTGRIVAELLCDGKSSIDISALRPDRFGPASRIMS